MNPVENKGDRTNSNDNTSSSDKKVNSSGKFPGKARKPSVFARPKERPVKSRTGGKASKAGDEVEVATMKEFCIEKIEDVIRSSIPDEVKELPQPYMTRMSILCIIGSVFIFFFFLVTQIKSGTRTSFISLDKSAGSCEAVPKGITQSTPFIATTTGRWEGEEAFQFKDSSYSLYLSNFNGNQQEYTKMMTHFKEDLIAFSKISSNELATFNAVMWLSFYSEYITESNGIKRKQVFRLNGTPNFVYYPLYAYGGFANTAGACAIKSYPQFDVSINSYNFGYLKTDFSTNNCSTYQIFISNSAMPISSNYVYYSIQMESLTTALAVNLGILPLSALEYVFAGQGSNGIYKAGNLIMNTLYDPKYPASLPSVCFDRSVYPDIASTYNISKSFCTYNFMNSAPKLISLPVLTPQGDSIDYYTGAPKQGYQCPPCGSSTNDDDFTDDKGGTSKRNLYCRTFYFYMGVLQWTDVDDFLAFLEKFNYDFEAINTASFNAAYWAINGPYNANANVKFSGSITDSFEFCDYKCSYVGVANVPMDPYNTFINPYFKKLEDANCNSEIYNEVDFERLIVSPPATLTEKYYKCFNKPGEIFLDAVGIANGNMAVLVPLGIAFILPLVYQYFKVIGYDPPKKEYSNEEKEEALNQWAVQLLRARDGKTRAFSSKSPVVAIAKELMKAEVTPPGYPDSDDEGSDDDDDSDDEYTSKSRVVKSKEGKTAAVVEMEQMKSRSNPATINKVPTGADNSSEANFNPMVRTANIKSEGKSKVGKAKVNKEGGDDGDHV